MCMEICAESTSNNNTLTTPATARPVGHTMQISRGQSLLPKISGKNSNRITINIGGVRYETYRSTLKNIPDTRLAWVTNTTASNPDYDPVTGEYFFDRHPGIFNMILNYYRTGKLHAPTDVCGPLFEEELAFWGIDERQIEPCCWTSYRAHRDAQETLAEFDNENNEDDVDEESHEDEIARRFGLVHQVTKVEKAWYVRWREGWYDRWRPKVWTVLEDPTSSTPAKVVTVITSLFVLLSIATFCAETHPLFRINKENMTLPSSATVKDSQQLTEPYLFLKVFEAACMVYFTFDLLVRFCFCPDKGKHVLQAQTVFDVMSVLPFYIRVTVVAIDPDFAVSDGLYFLNSFRLIMIFRILKLTRHFSGFKILGHTLKASAKELLLMILLLSIGVLTFACLIYYAEQVVEGSANDFKNIPRGFWWAVVTMTTLGYGDMYPRTALGYLVGAGCALCGLLMLALPVPVIVNNFTLYYSHAQAKLKLPKKARNTLVGAADALKSSVSDPESCPPSLTGSNSSLMSASAPITTTTRRDSMKQPPEDRGSLDSGYKAGSQQDVNVGISVIFTDEIDVLGNKSPKKSQSMRTLTTNHSKQSAKEGSGHNKLGDVSRNNHLTLTPLLQNGHSNIRGTSTHSKVIANQRTETDHVMVGKGEHRTKETISGSGTKSRSNRNGRKLSDTGYHDRRRSLFPVHMADIDV